MEKDKLIHNLCSHSKVNIFETLVSVTKSSQTDLENGFQFDDISKYCYDLRLLQLLINYSSEKSQNNPTNEFVSHISEEVMKKVCYKLLVHVCPSIDSRKEYLVLLGALCELTAACVCVHPDIMLTMIEGVHKSVCKHIAASASENEGQSDSGVLDVYTALEIARHILPKVHTIANTDDEIEAKMKSYLAELFKNIVSAIRYFTHDFIGTNCLPVILRLLDLDGANIGHNLHRLWLCIQALSELGPEENKHFILLCGLANWYFPVSGTDPGCVEAVQNDEFWVMLQQGLLSTNPLTRKRSLYLLKRIVDICEMTDMEVSSSSTYPRYWWSKTRKADLSKTWQDFMLLAEVLEEKQVHVIRPLLPRMKSLITASSKTASQDSPLLHTSWLITILLRCAHHESLQIIRWSADTMLSLDLHSCPMLEQGQQKYLTGQLLNILRDTKLYNREPGSPSGHVPALGQKLVDFFQACWKTLPPDKRSSYFCETVQNICSSHWGTTPLIYVCRALSMVPCSPCLDKETILQLRHLLTGDLVTAEPYLRGAITGFVTQLLINLVDTSQVFIEDVMQVLILVQQDDCLQRGTTLWVQCVDWLRALSAGGDNSSWSAEEIVKHLDNSFNKYQEVTEDSKFSTADTVSAHPITRLLLLASEANIVTSQAADEPDVLTRVTGKLTMILNSINSHSYMSRHKADKAIQMLVLLVKESAVKELKQDVTVTKVILNAVESCQSEMLLYIGTQIQECVVTEQDRWLLGLYEDAVGMLADVRYKLKAINFEKITLTCIAILNRHSQQAQKADLPGKMQHLAGMCILGKIADFLSHDLTCDTQHPGNQTLKQLITDFLKNWIIVNYYEKPTSEQNVNQKEWGKITSLYLQHQWQVVLLGLQLGAATLCSVTELIALATGTMSVGLEETSIIVMRCLAGIIKQPEYDISDSDYLSMINTCWTSLQESRRSQVLWSVLEAFVRVVFHSRPMSIEEGSPLLEKMREVAMSLIDYGTEKMGVVNLLTDQLTSVWSIPGMIKHALKWTHIIVKLCKFGGQPTKGQRQLYDVAATVEVFGSSCAVNSLKKSISNGDLLVRVAIVDFLCGLDPSDSVHCSLATDLVRLCSSNYTTVLQGSNNSYANSLVHRQRHRLIQTVLLLESFVTQDYVSELWQFVWTSLEQECQPSIRHVLEWIAMAIMTKYPIYGQELWTKFEKYRDSKNVVMCSLLCLAIHLGPQLPAGKQLEFYQHALPCILPWCMAHHFTTRIFAQATLCKLWTQCQDLQLHTILNANQVLQGLVDFNQENRNSTTNVKKLLDSFFFKSLDFKNDFTLEILYHILPTMTDLTEEDWILPDMFVKLNPAWAQGQRSHFIALRNNTDHLELSHFTKWKYSAFKIFEEGEESGDVQKKIMPWKQMVPDLETADEIDHGVKAHNEGGLVVVTSLITKVPNLGGLCRTSEIFGVSEYVLGKLKLTEDKAFQGLSVTAHKWVPITEVGEPKLPEYLQQKRQEGYTLIGVEQTANSVCLTDYTFPVKSLLLLGNEKEGIPVNLISLLDVCVEIPQQGVIRSLNVHVSGALLIWEYRRQQLVNGKGTS